MNSHRLRYVLPALPLYIWLLPIAFFWSLDWALAIMIYLIHAFYPYVSAWDGPVSSGSSQLEHGTILALAHWVVTLGFHFFVTRNMTDRKALAQGLATIFISSLAAHVFLAAAGYHVNVYIDF